MSGGARARVRVRWGCTQWVCDDDECPGFPSTSHTLSAPFQRERSSITTTVIGFKAGHVMSVGDITKLCVSDGNCDVWCFDCNWQLDFDWNTNTELYRSNVGGWKCWLHSVTCRQKSPPTICSQRSTSRLVQTRHLPLETVSNSPLVVHIAPQTEAPPSWSHSSSASWLLNWRQHWQRGEVSVMEGLKAATSSVFYSMHSHAQEDTNTRWQTVTHGPRWPWAAPFVLLLFKKRKKKKWRWITGEWPCFCSQNLGGGSTVAVELRKDWDFI